MESEHPSESSPEPGSEPSPESGHEPDRDLAAVEELERELAVLERELDTADDRSPAAGDAGREPSE
jgi:hypothetical protein